jgi:hypothetical protein
MTDQIHAEFHGVCSGIKFTRGRDGISRVFLDYGNIRVEVLSNDGAREYVSGHRINALIREAVGADSHPPAEPIIIEVFGGVVQDVLNVPEGIEYEIKDYDNMEETA